MPLPQKKKKDADPGAAMKIYLNGKCTMMKKHRCIRIISLVLVIGAFVSFTAAGVSVVRADDFLKKQHIEHKGKRDVVYQVNNIDALEKPYNYVIGSSTPIILEIFGILAILGAIFFGIAHGYGRYLGHKRNPVILELEGREYIYNLAIRMGHWANAVTIMMLVITGFIMHYAGASHTLGYLHHIFGMILVLLYGAFVAHEVATLDLAQYLSQDWELREGILRQALFYIKGIFKREEHPYHMKRDNRLNPLQKVAYFGVMFGLMPLVVITGMILIKPAWLNFIVSYIGMENMKWIFMAHLVGAFGVVAFLIGHVYLGTTGDTLSQHFEVMVNGYHKVYSYRSPDEEKK